MKEWKENKIENMIRSSTFPNSVHKQALWKQLFESADELNLDDLDAAAGGAAIAEPENRKHGSPARKAGNEQVQDRRENIIAIDREELKKKALEAASAEEIVALLKDAGEEVTAEEAKKLFEKVQAQTADKELSQDELEAVSGGAMRNWVTDGCASEVTSSSWCVFNDFCWATWVTYDNRPVMTCPKCFNYMYESGSDSTYTYYTCKSCGAKHRKLK